MTDVFASSDSVRSSSASVHARVLRLEGRVELEKGETLPFVDVCYETYGTLNAGRSNAVLVCHAISGDSHVARHDDADLPGWWELCVGPGKAIDTNKYFVICSNVLGGCRGTTGPISINPDTGKPYGAGFPVVTIPDIVDVQARLLTQLGIDTLHAAVGGSLGGMQALTWALRFPQRIRNAVLLASAPRLTSQALAFDVVARNAILRDPHFHNGDYYDKDTNPAIGLALARMLGHITYLSREAMTAKFDATRLSPREVDTQFEKQFSVGSYLAYQGHKFVERFDANSYVTITRALDLFDLGDTIELLRNRLSDAQCRWLVLSFTSDWLFPPEQSRMIVDALVQANKPVSFCNVTSGAGHDAFLLEDSLDVYGAMIERFLNGGDVSGELPRTGAKLPSAPESADHSTSIVRSPQTIFRSHRLDYDLMLDLIEPGSRVLDLGCGDGAFLSLLRASRSPARLLGIENDQYCIRDAVARGLDVVHADLEEPLPNLLNQSFDVVVLSQTLQTVGATERVIDEMLRVGKRAIVSFPNFGYYKLRQMYVQQGRAPRGEGGYAYEWYNSPNRRFPTILDFQDFCRAKQIQVLSQLYLDTNRNQRIAQDPNSQADVAIFVITRGVQSANVADELAWEI
ncbi:MAG: homoserine O-acetyltransferase [Tepidisphaeraceae bacterium]